MTIEHNAKPRLSNRSKFAAAAAALVALGGAAGAIAVGATRPSIEMAPIRPVAINSLASADSIITVRGRVAETYGNKFVLADNSGRALVDTGREGEDRQLVSTGQAVTVQGRFEHGFVHASFLIGADGKVVSLRPVGPPHGPGGRPGPHGPGEDRGVGGDRSAPPPLAADARAPEPAPDKPKQ